MGTRYWFAAFAALMLVMGQSVVAHAAEEAQLLSLINLYRSDVQRCGKDASPPLPPLAADARLLLPAVGRSDLQAAMTRSGYPMVNVQAISLSGPRDANAALQIIKDSFCQIVLDPQFVDIGISRADRDWRIVLARPMLAGRLGVWASGRLGVWVTGRLKGRNSCSRLMRPAVRHVSVALRHLMPPQRWPGMPPWAQRRKVIAAPWRMVTSLIIRTVMAARQETAQSWPVTAASGWGKTLPPGWTAQPRWLPVG
jgi:hypothetical protein